MCNLYKRPCFHTFVLFNVVSYWILIAATNSASKQNVPFSPGKLKFPYDGGMIGFGVVVGFGATVEFGEIVDFVVAVDFIVEITILRIAEWLDFTTDVVVWLACFDERLWTDKIVEFDGFDAELDLGELVEFDAALDLGELVGEGVGDINPWLSSTR